MNTFHHLLAATDLSSSSLHAVDRGFQLAGQTGARYTVVHALELDPLSQWRELLGGDISTLCRRIADETRDALTRQLSDPNRNRGVSAALRVESGMAVSTVRRCADDADADLLLLGAHGKGFLQRLVLGSTASRLVRTSKQPVLVVKEPCRAAYRRILVAVDFSPASGLAIELTRRIAPGAQLILFHVCNVPFEGKLQYAGVSDDVIHQYRTDTVARALRQLDEMAAAAGLSSTDYLTRVQHGDVSRRIISEEENSDCDLIVVGKHGTNVVEDLLLGSVTSHMLSESRSDVLVVVDKRMPADPGR